MPDTEELRNQLELRTIIVKAFDAGRDAAQYYGTDDMQKYRHAKVQACEDGEKLIEAYTETKVKEAVLPIAQSLEKIENPNNTLEWASKYNAVVKAVKLQTGKLATKETK